MVAAACFTFARLDECMRHWPDGLTPASAVDKIKCVSHAITSTPRRQGWQDQAQEILPVSVTADAPVSSLVVNGIRLDAIERGEGRPLLFLHPGIGIDPSAPVLDHLACAARVIAPLHPGFGGSDLPKSMTTVDDLAYFYLDLLDALHLDDAILVGVSFGAWIAAEIAIKSTERLSHLVLANAVGIKPGGREARDIADIFAMTEPQFL